MVLCILSLRPEIDSNQFSPYTSSHVPRVSTKVLNHTDDDTNMKKNETWMKVYIVQIENYFL